MYYFIEKERPLWKLWKRGWPSLPSLVREGTQVAALNDLLHQYGPYIVGRMGVPYREKGVNIISVAMDAPGDVISALSGKLGRLEGDHRQDRLCPGRGAYEGKKNHELERKTVGAGLSLP